MSGSSVRWAVAATAAIALLAGCEDREQQEDNQGVGAQADTQVQRRDPTEAPDVEVPDPEAKGRDDSPPPER